MNGLKGQHHAKIFLIHTSNGLLNGEVMKCTFLIFYSL